jgi:type IV pilus assembly protein PilE
MTDWKQTYSMSIKRTSGGVSLIELMVALVILGIIAGIGYPSYQSYVRESRRAEGRNLLLDAANREERFFADNNTYTADMTQLGYAADPAVSENGTYSLDAAATPTSYTLTVTAQGAQAADSSCDTLSIASTGAKTSTGGGDCW